MRWLVLFLAACSPPLDDGKVRARARSFSTEGCRASSLAPTRPHPGTRPGFLDWSPPERAPVDLLTAPHKVSGEASDAAGHLLRWEGDALVRRREGPDVVFVGPMPEAGLAGAVRVRVGVRPGSARSVQVVPSPEATVTRRLAALRMVTLTLDDPPDADTVVILEAHIDDALRGNWGDDKKNSSRLHSLEVAFVNTGPVAPEVTFIEVLGEEAMFAGQAAGRRTVGLKDVLHPSWFAHGGASVSWTVHVPDDGADLHYYGGRVGPASWALSVLTDDGVEASLSVPSLIGEWRPSRVSLTPWAGRSVTLQARAAGDGVALLGAPRVEPLGAERAPNVIVYLIDTLRADHVGAFGSPVPGVTPTLDRLAAEGTQFAFAQSTSPWTKPAIPTVMTGTWPTTHRVGSVAYTDKLSPLVPMLQDRFHEAGYRTGSFTASPLGTTLSGLERGFDTAMPPTAWSGALGRLGHVAADQLHEALFAWHDEDPDRPFYAYVHTLEVHGWPRGLYASPPDGYTPYDFAVQDADSKLGDLIAELERRDLADNTLVVIVSDHGESFGDHGVRDHGTGLYQSQIHVPFILWAGTSVPPQTITHPVGLADLAPTVLDVVGLPPLPDADGLSLRPYLEGPTPFPLHEAVPSARIRYIWQPRADKLYAWTAATGLKTLREGHADRLFDLSRDLCEGQSLDHVLVSHRTALDAWLAAEAADGDAFQDRYGASGSGAVDDADVELLRELGYLE